MGITAWTWIAVGGTFALYAVVALWAKAHSTVEYYVADRTLHPAVYGMATATDWMSAEGRAKLRAYGIAPPVAETHGAADEAAVECPQCGSHDTRCVSEFGSTACKALYQCRSCREPFDYFKCL